MLLSRDIPFLVLTPEQRLMLRSVPFFLLPDYETLPNLSRVRSKVNTKNPRYACTSLLPVLLINFLY